MSHYVKIDISLLFCYFGSFDLELVNFGYMRRTLFASNNDK